ncbi:glutaminyl-peptide cyclotransferase [Pedobacter sp. ASV12]|uniref:glutaminyl-peptide cyclotransferase n=1 Tax=Pedobacter sp. ASV12 TaxID=2795120 RepID=UPI0018EA3AA1|nr:glutaminyl-peptide cyclotransferase [Pedobacter sp. ASV12]
MHFGLFKTDNLIPVRLGVLLAVLFGLASCKHGSTSSYTTFSAPQQGQQFVLGQPITLSLDLDKSEKIEEISYYLDGKLKAYLHDNVGPVSIKSDSLSLGYKNLTAIVTKDGKNDTITTNIVLTSGVTPKPLRYQVVNTFPHDTSAYTEGLAYVEGKLLESTGEYGSSKLKYVDLKTGKTLQQIQLPAQYFGEGSLKLGNKIIMLTWKENTGFVFDAQTFKQLATFPFSREGWGLAFDGQKILRTDGSNRIWFMNADTYQEEGYIEVYDNKGQVEQLNELEFIDGKIYANVYQTNKIVRIDPKTGVIEAEIDLTALVPKNFFKTQDEVNGNVLNGIAWDAKGKRLFVVGKKWPKLYEIKLLNE